MLTLITVFMNKILFFVVSILLAVTLSGCRDNNGDEYLVKLFPSEGGVSEGEGAYAKESVVTVIATPNEDYEFENWREYYTGEILSQEANYSFTITKDIGLVAYFKETTENIIFIDEHENFEMSVIANYSSTIPLNQLSILTRYIGDLFLNEGISKDKSGANNQGGITQMVINTHDLENRGIYEEIQGGGPHIWIAKQPSEDSIIYPWANPKDELTFQMYASVPIVELEDKDGNTANSGFTATQAPVTQLSFGFYLHDDTSDGTLAYIIPVYESRGTYQESANNSDTYVSFISTPLEASSNYISKAQESASLQEIPFVEKKFFKVVIKPENILKAIRDTNIDLSEDLSNYKLTFAGVLFELPNYVKDGHNISMVYVSDFSAYVK